MDSPDSNIIHSPGDRFVKAVFGNPGRCAEALRLLLPQLVPLLSHSSLRREPEHFVEPNLREKITDLLFSVQIEDRMICPYLLFEHRGRPSSFARLDLLGYQHKIWTSWRRAHSGSRLRNLPVIIPIVFYAGRRAWNCSKQFADLTGVIEGLEKSAIHFEHLLIDMTRVDWNAVQGTLWLWMVGGLMKAVAQGEVRDWMRTSGAYWEQLLSQDNLVGLAETMLRYCVEADSRRSFSTIDEVVSNVSSTRTKDRIMSLAEKLIQQGREEGLEKGLEKGRQEGALIGRIQTYQDLLGQRESSAVNLARLTVSELRAKAEALQRRLQNKTK